MDEAMPPLGLGERYSVRGLPEKDKIRKNNIPLMEGESPDPLADRTGGGKRMPYVLLPLGVCRRHAYATFGKYTEYIILHQHLR